jgi:hypothetical protein
MASVKDFTPTPEQLQGQKLGGEKLSETAFTKQPVAPASKQTGGVTSKVSSFTPTAEELAAQRYETVGAQGGKPLAKIVTAEKVAKNPPLPAIEAPELKASMQRGIEPRSTLSLAPEQASKFEMPLVKGGYENIPQQKAGIFKTRPSAIKEYAKFASAEAAERAAVPTPIQRTIEATTGVGPQSDVRPMTMDEARMQKSISDVKAAGAERVAAAKQTAQTATPAATTVVDTTIPKYASEAARSGAMSLSTGLAGSIIQSPEIAQQTNEALRRKGLKGIIPQQGGEEMLTTQFGRWLGGKAYDIMNPSAEQPKATEPAATAQQPVTPEQPAKPAPLSTQDTNLAAGAQLPGGGTVGTQEPVIDFSQRPATIPLKQGQTEMQRGTEIEKTAQERGQAVSKGKGGNFRYVQGPNGTVVKQNIDTGEVVPMGVQGITGNVLKPGEESPLAREVKERKAAQAEAKEAAFRDTLLRMAQDQGDGTFTGMGQAKRNRKLATQLLTQMDSRNQAAAQLGMEEKKLASSERATAATQEQNRLAREQQAQYQQERLGLDERKTIAAEEAARNKPRVVTYKGEVLRGTPEDIEIGKRQTDEKLAAQWDKTNPKPSSMLTTNDDVVKYFEKRAKALGFDPNISQAASLAQQIKSLQGKLTPEDSEVVTKEFQSKYGVPYSEFIASE